MYKATLGKNGYNIKNKQGKIIIKTNAKFDDELFLWLEESGFKILNMLCYNQLILIDMK